jgi:hypothetical protein
MAVSPKLSAEVLLADEHNAPLLRKAAAFFGNLDLQAPRKIFDLGQVRHKVMKAFLGRPLRRGYD